jgi:hypothetical protein
MIEFILIILVAFVIPTPKSNAQNLVGYTFSSEQKETPFKLELEPFTTDGCTKYHDGTKENPTLWLHCCIAHDIAYWLGGTSDERKAADDNLFQCVSATGQPKTARIMYIGTRAGGGPLGQNSYRWGFGWNRVRDYKLLSDREKQMAYDMYGENLEGLKSDIGENKFTVKVPKNYDIVSKFPYSFCDEEIINYLSPMLKTAKVTKYREFQLGSTYSITLGLDICEGAGNIEFHFSAPTTQRTCKQDLAYQDTINKFSDVAIPTKCLKKIRAK